MVTTPNVPMTPAPPLPPAPIYKTVTHMAAIALGALVTFAMTPAGQALVKQYPYLTGVVALATMLATLYHIPVQGAPHA